MGPPAVVWPTGHWAHTFSSVLNTKATWGCRGQVHQTHCLVRYIAWWWLLLHGGCLLHACMRRPHKAAAHGVDGGDACMSRRAP